MRAMDVIMAFPQIMLALVAVCLIGPKNWVTVIAIALTTAPRVARVARGAAQPVIERDFIGATEAMGLSRVRIIGGELFPNILGPMMVEASLRLTYSIAVIAALAFLGLSNDPNGPNWGTMIQQNQGSLAYPAMGCSPADPGDRLAHDGHGSDRRRDRTDGGRHRPGAG